MTEESARVKSTKKRIENALFDLLRNDPIDRITVSEVCGRAKVNRSTFYNHFYDIYDVRQQAENTIMGAIEKAFPPFMEAVILGREDAHIGFARTHLEPHFERIGILLDGGDHRFVERLREFAQNKLLELLDIDEFSEHQEYVFNAIVGMQLGLLGFWLRTNRTLPIQELLALDRVLFTEGPRTAMLTSMTAKSARKQAATKPTVRPATTKPLS